MPAENLILTAVVGVVVAVSYAFFRMKERALRAELLLKEKGLMEQARTSAENSRVQARLDAQEELAKWRAVQDQELERVKERLDASDLRVADREALVNRQTDRQALTAEELKQRGASLEALQVKLDLDREEIHRIGSERRSQLEQLSGLNALDARILLLKEVEKETSADAANLSRHIMEKARTASEEQARRILSTVIQRYAGRHTFETSTATVALTGDEMKGRIIGRDGRNIRAFENVTGVTVLVDDTPNAVVLSGFDPVRREIGRQSMERLILDGRIHPTRIEEVVAVVTQEMEEFILRKGEEAIVRAGQSPMHPEVARMLGRLHFRLSFSQNILEHSIEVAQLAGLMASELGEDPVQARRAGLLHDIGKALSHEVEGPHALVGADFIKRHGEGGITVNAVAAHHDEVPHESLFGILVSAADAISASRPGSRSEGMVIYLKRLADLEQIALDFEGVERAFAIQAGREVRVVVKPEAIDDRDSMRLARDIARRIEEQMLYPGQIRITVIRETRYVEYAK